MTDIRQLLMEANPVPSRVEVPDVVRAEVMAEVHRTPPRRRFTRRWQWPLPTILVALVAAGGVATAAALLIPGETKQQSVALASAPPVRVDAGRTVPFGPAHAAIAEKVMATTPYPPGVRDTFDWASYRLPGSATGDVAGTITWLVHHRATCLWRDYWVRAHEAGETTNARDAVAILRQAARWPSLKLDHGVMPVIERRAADAAAEGDVATVRALSRVDCDGVP